MAACIYSVCNAEINLGYGESIRRACCFNRRWTGNEIDWEQDKAKFGQDFRNEEAQCAKNRDICLDISYIERATECAA